jgi:hypothetical protein
MKFTIQVLIESPDALPLSVAIQTIERSCERVEDVGLRLDEAKAILQGLQEQLVRQQLAGYLDAHRPCPCCHRLRAIKGNHRLRFRSAFGGIELRSPRWCRCACEERSTQATYSALNAILTMHTAPELEFLQAKWAAHLSFTAVAELLHDVLPVDTCLNGETIRMHVFATAERLEAELGPEQFAFDAGCQLEIEASPGPGPPVTVDWMAATSVVESGNPAEPDVLRSLPGRVFLKKVRPRYLRACGGSIRNPSVDYTRYCNRRGCFRGNR